jgi:hypothetical protein
MTEGEKNATRSISHWGVLTTLVRFLHYKGCRVFRSSVLYMGCEKLGEKRKSEEREERGNYTTEMAKI